MTRSRRRRVKYNFMNGQYNSKRNSTPEARGSKATPSFSRQSSLEDRWAALRARHITDGPHGHSLGSQPAHEQCAVGPRGCCLYGAAKLDRNTLHQRPRHQSALLSYYLRNDRNGARAKHLYPDLWCGKC
ncbi:ORF3 [Sugarcane umbra-like virus]|nr:ORF3 [Sugarcane umbra-like virus]